MGKNILILYNFESLVQRIFNLDFFYKIQFITYIFLNKMVHSPKIKSLYWTSYTDVKYYITEIQ